MTLYLEIFWIFFKIGFLSFGGVFGVLPELERMIVHDHQWITHDAFIQSYVIAQFVPGPNMAMCPLIGFWVAGWGAAVAGFTGIYLPPLIVMAAGFWTQQRYANHRFYRNIEWALRPVVAGLLLASVIRLWESQSRGLHSQVEWPTQIFALTLAALGLWIYLQKKAGALALIFGMGIVWWAGNLFLLN